MDNFFVLNQINPNIILQYANYSATKYVQAKHDLAFIITG